MARRDALVEGVDGEEVRWLETWFWSHRFSVAKDDWVDNFDRFEGSSFNDFFAKWWWAETTFFWKKKLRQ